MLVLKRALTPGRASPQGGFTETGCRCPYQASEWVNCPLPPRQSEGGRPVRTNTMPRRFQAAASGP
jgi:hypothetical protein